MIVRQAWQSSHVRSHGEVRPVSPGRCCTDTGERVASKVWKTKVDGDGGCCASSARRGSTSVGKLTAYLRRIILPEPAAGSGDRAMRTLGPFGSGA